MRKLIAIFALMTFSAGLWAETQFVNYIDADGVQQTVTATVITSGTTTLNAGWYVVNGAAVRTGSLTCNGAVHLILADGAKLTATGGYISQPGIQVSGDGNSLTIYGQTAQSGQLIANGEQYAAGIGGGRDESGSDITINGGVVTATGGIFAAGIGCGLLSDLDMVGQIGGSDITINGGAVTANGGDDGAGIGGGLNGFGSDITINGGNVTANGGTRAAGIGGGQYGSGSGITINGGAVTANGGYNGSGIGGGENGSGSNIIIAATILVKADSNNPPVTVIPNTGTDLAGSLAGKQHVTTEPIVITYGEHITVSPEFASGDNVAYGTEITFTAVGRWDDCYDFVGFYKESTFETPITEGVSGQAYIVTVKDAFISVYAKYEQFTPIHYINADGQEKNANATEITNGTTTLDAGWYVAFGNDVQTGTLTCNGAVHLILADGAKLTATGDMGDYHSYNSGTPGIQVSGDGSSLTIYGQTAQSGKLFTTGGFHAAGIGGGFKGSGSNITINGGIVTATGGFHAAGIGGGSNGSGSNITINGGTVTANGGLNGAGIGGGSNGSGSNITINGGTVMANGVEAGAGIGGGSNGSGSNIITINGGVVTANGGYGGAGIGSGQIGSVSDITINGGVVTANGGSEGAGIGGGLCGSVSGITINGGVVTANGGKSGIGAGSDGDPSSNIFVAAELVVRAGNDNPPVTVIAADRTATTDIAGDLDGKRYATVRIPQGGVVTYGDYITVSPQFASGDRVASETEVTFTAEDRFANNYDFLGFYKESTFENKITNGVSGLTYTVMVLDDDISVYAKYEEFTPTPYIDANGQEQSVKTTEITSETSTLNAGWYAVLGNDVRTASLTCKGEVNLILADGAKLTATGRGYQAGINVSGNGSSLTIYGQTAQSGQLIATGGEDGAGIGGGQYGNGSNITINGGTVTANGGGQASGIGGGYYMDGSNITINGGTVTANGGDQASGIGGGYLGNGSNITINGGTVTANGGENDGAGIGGGDRSDGSNIIINGGTVIATGGNQASAIGGGSEGSGSDIMVVASLTVCADNTNPPTTEIPHTDNDIASHIAVFRYVTVKDVTTGVKESAIAAINAAIEGVTNADIIAIATNAIDAINAATSADVINAIKEQALAAIAYAKAIYASALGEMGEPCEDCPAVDVTKGTTTIRLYNPEKVEFRKMEYSF